ncbi:MAG: helix-turn-helix domain-containing protein [Phycisphaerales bacterium]|nr:helix-turn-helix domain-containing protein [Phycisphaerales bacterium]
MKQSVMIDVKPQGLSTHLAKRAYTTGEVASLTGLSQQTVIRCFDAGRINGFRVPGSATRRIPREELVRFMQANGIPLEEAGGSSYRVLLIDDEPETIEAVTTALEAMDRIGLDVASNAWEAGVLAASASPDLAIVNARLSDLNMEQVCKTLRGRGESNPTRVIAMARRYKREEMEVLRELGVESFLRPPLQRDDILELLPEKLVS